MVPFWGKPISRVKCSQRSQGYEMIVACGCNLWSSLSDPTRDRGLRNWTLGLPSQLLDDRHEIFEMVDFTISDVKRVRKLQLNRRGPLLPSDPFVQIAVRCCEEDFDFVGNM